jgi:hypothetical protein
MEMQLYFFWSSISMTIFYLFYLVLLKRETFFLVNRIYLLCALCLSIMLPLLDFSTLMPLPKMQLLFSSLPTTGNGELTIVNEKDFSWLPTIYWAGVVLTSTWLLFKLSNVKRQIRRAEKGSAFSFWKTKVIDQSLTNLSAIDAHENVHVTQLHTLDTLLIEVISIFFWFNPVIYCYSRSLRLIHEYQADDHAASFAESKKQYATMLFFQNFKAGPLLTNTFYSPLSLEARIRMLQCKKSSPYQLLKYTLCIPLIVLLILMCSFNSVNLNGNGINKSDQAATFPGGFKVFSEYLLKNTRSVSKVNGRVVVSFIIDVNGEVVDEKVDSSLNEDCDKEALRVIKFSPKWIPALKDGKEIRSAYQIGLNFRSGEQ